MLSKFLKSKLISTKYVNSLTMLQEFSIKFELTSVFPMNTICSQLESTPFLMSSSKISSSCSLKNLLGNQVLFSSTLKMGISLSRPFTRKSSNSLIKSSRAITTMSLRIKILDCADTMGFIKCEALLIIRNNSMST